MRHNSQVIKQVIRMRNEGLTLGEIVSKTGLSKTTIFHHIKALPKSSILVNKLRAISVATQKVVADQRRGKSVKSYTFLKPEKWSPDFVNLIAHFNFDGDVRHTSSNYNNRNQALIEKVKNNMKGVLNVDDFKIYKDIRTEVYKLCYFHVELAAFVKQKSQDLFNYINSASSEEKQSFLQAFFDDEGCVTFENKKRVVRGYQHSLRILKIVQRLLQEFGIESRISEKYFEVTISRKSNLLKFQQCINFTPGVCVNGNRANSIWKKPLEKREILKQALDSYTT